MGTEIERGRTSSEDDPREGRPRTTEEIIENIYNVVLDDPRINVLDSISEERARHILHEKLRIRKLCTKIDATFVKY